MLPMLAKSTRETDVIQEFLGLTLVALGHSVHTRWAVTIDPQPATGFGDTREANGAARHVQLSTFGLQMDLH